MRIATIAVQEQLAQEICCRAEVAGFSIASIDVEALYDEQFDVLKAGIRYRFEGDDEDREIMIPDVYKRDEVLKREFPTKWADPIC